MQVRECIVSVRADLHDSRSIGGGDAPRGKRVAALDRRTFVAGAASFTAFHSRQTASAADAPFQFGLTPVFLTSDLVLLEALQSYLTRAVEAEVRLVLKRTYQEITSQLVAGQIDAAWICGFPFVAYQPQLSLVAVPIWRGRNTYQSYLIAASRREASAIEDLRGDTHAFSDPDSNSGYLVTRALLIERKLKSDSFFFRSFFTYGHRNVVRAVASGLAQSGSVDGYVWEVMTETEPELTRRTRVIWKSEWMGFPPIATSNAYAGNARIQRLKAALVRMPKDETGRRVLSLLRLDGFQDVDPALFDSIGTRVELVRREG
jgi:phosphonate transport system substrate-binding protein